MASVASADNWVNLGQIGITFDTHYAGLPEYDYYSFDSFSIRFCIETGDLEAGQSTMLAYLRNHTTSDQMSLCLQADGTSYSLRAGIHGGYTDVDSILWFSTVDISGLQENVVYTLTTSGGDQSGVTLTGSDGSVLTSGDAVHENSVLWPVDNVASSVPLMMNETFAAAAPVPEPATTTLSLLALAGLAARRRRK